MPCIGKLSLIRVGVYFSLPAHHLFPLISGALPKPVAPVAAAVSAGSRIAVYGRLRNPRGGPE